MSLGISSLAAVSRCKTDDDGTQLLMTSLGPARSAQSGLHSEQVGFYCYLNCKIMAGIFHSKIKLPTPPHSPPRSYNNTPHLRLFLVWSSVQSGVSQLVEVSLLSRSTVYILWSSVLVCCWITQPSAN